MAVNRLEAEPRSGGSRISVRGMRRVSGPHFFSEGMTPTFYGRLLARIGLTRIFRGWVRPGVDPGFLFGGRWKGRRPRTRRGRRGGAVWGGAHFDAFLRLSQTLK